MTKHWTLWLGLVVAAALVSACGGQTELIDINAVATATAAAAQAAAPAPDLGAGEPATPVDAAGGSAGDVAGEGGGGVEEDAPVGEGVPADEGGDVAPEGAPPEAAIATPLPAFNFTDPDFSAFSSYSANLTAYLEDAGGQRTGSMNLMMRVDAQASAAHVEMLVEGAMVNVVSSGSEEPAPDHMVIVLRDGVTYMLGMTPDGGCMALAGGAPDITSPDSPFTPTGFLPDAASMGELALVGPGGTVNGVPTTQYHLEEGQLTADVWVADDAGHVVRLVAAMPADAFSEGQTPPAAATGIVRMEYNLTSVNQPLNIETPPECVGVTPMGG